MSQRYIDTGKCWLKNVFERISTELKDTVVLTRWNVQDNDPDYCLRFQIADQQEEALSFTRGTLRACGKGDGHTVRRRVEAAIRHRLLRGDTAGE